MQSEHTYIIHLLLQDFQFYLYGCKIKKTTKKDLGIGIQLSIVPTVKFVGRYCMRYLL